MQSQKGFIDLYYGDETRISEEGYVPYGWQFDEEDVYIASTRGKAINCFGLLSRTLDFFYETSSDNINAAFVVRVMDAFSFKIVRPTVVVLDNASVHTARKIKELLEVWQKRGLYIFYLPPYCPHLNIIERFWKELKEGWLKPEDYKTTDTLFYAVNRILAAVGIELKINFSEFIQI